MNRKKYLASIIVCLFVLIFAGCKQPPAEGEKPAAEPPKTETIQETVAPKSETKEALPDVLPQKEVPLEKEVKSKQAVAIEVNGRKFLEADLNKQLSSRLAQVPKNVPKGQLKEVQSGIRKQLLDEFVIRTVLTDEVNRRKITIKEQEIEDAVKQLTRSLPEGVTLDQALKKNRISKAKFREDLRLGLLVNKMIADEIGKWAPAEKDIKEFYQKNSEHFKVPESVKARHILITTNDKDDENSKKEKKAKGENLRKQLLGGADFAALARENSDCPSKENGGDLGNFQRGQMVKPFEDAAFSQKINEIGPLVETDFGWHIIQVLERNPESVTPLDEQLSNRIASFLEQDKKQNTFNTLLETLRSKAKIVVYGK